METSIRSGNVRSERRTAQTRGGEEAEAVRYAPRLQQELYFSCACILNSADILQTPRTTLGRQLFEADRTLIASDAKFAEEGVDVDVTLFEAMDLNDLDEQDEDDDDAVAAILRAATED